MVPEVKEGDVGVDGEFVLSKTREDKIDHWGNLQVVDGGNLVLVMNGVSVVLKLGTWGDEEPFEVTLVLGGVLRGSGN